MADQIGVGIIGASGGMGQSRLRHFQEDPRCRIVAACARDLERLREAVSDESIRLAADPGEVLAADDVDAVVVSTPNRFHYEQVKGALNAGKHVHCEYPLVDNLDLYDELTELARGKGLVLHHGLTVRAEGHQLSLKQALQGLGEPRAAYYRYYGGEKWYVDPALRGDLFCGLHIHFMDQFIDLFGQPERIAAHGLERDGKVSAVVMMGWSTGLVGTIEFAMGFTDKPGYMGTIVTTDGWCGFSMAEEPQITVERGGKTTVTTPPPDVSKELDARSFIDQILGTGGPLSDLETGRNAIALCLECSRQLATIGS